MGTIGRPTSYTAEIGQAVLDLIVDETPLAEIGERDGLPAKRTILDWASGEVEGVPDDFPHRYARAMELQADSRFDGLRQIARDVEEGGRDSINAARLMIDTEKWILARQYRAKYGDRSAIDHGNQPDNPLISTDPVRDMSDEARKKIQKILDDDMQAEGDK